MYINRHMEQQIIEALKIWLKNYKVDLKKLSTNKRKLEINTEQEVLKQLPLRKCYHTNAKPMKEHL